MLVLISYLQNHNNLLTLEKSEHLNQSNLQQIFNETKFFEKLKVSKFKKEKTKFYIQRGFLVPSDVTSDIEPVKYVI